MDSVSLKLDRALARDIGWGMRFGRYSTKTEFIREAIRGKLALLRAERKKEEAWDKLLSMRGALKGKGKFKTDEEWHKWRSNEGSKMLEEYFDKKYGPKP